ncbi:MAG: Iron-sulfur cluster insertion protein ErpA [Chlamydiales bacterium]|nr:Iron-sulfur cluster insertion protein ErpA [Chlamydiales bacterium]MCH9635994.1 Iron-sulfur cluster insertion protein ErpA [Chlamydiales bacterium]MCH9703761.1 iron-sulfur cluster assembly accessory protein [Chlamydiota bacterium]
MADTIDRHMTISDIISKFPAKSQRIAQALTNAGLHCTSCSAATWETLEAGMLGHGMNDGQIVKLVNEINEILAEEIDLETISITKMGAEKFREFAKGEGFSETACLRFGDMAGGCGGFQYLLDFCESADEDDTTYECEGVTICVKNNLVGRLLGCVIDYVDGINGSGFKISNPNVKSSCGCGHSQNY